MMLARIFLVVAIVLGAMIGFGVYKKKTQSAGPVQEYQTQVSGTLHQQPIELDVQSLSSNKENENKRDVNVSSAVPEKVRAKQEEALPDANRIQELFQKPSPLPIVETIRYKSRVSWKPGRAAWLIDYAFHYKTPLDFIARSINKKPVYTIPKIVDGIECNVLRLHRPFHFYLVVDLSRNKMWFYYIDLEAQERVLLKTYSVCTGRVSSERVSGFLTPIGKYKVGTRIAVLKPKMMGMHKGKRVELVQVFGSRWIPFEKEEGNVSDVVKGLGIHGTPWVWNATTHTLVPDDSGIGQYESDGCIRLNQQDVEELYAIITTRDAFVEIVKDFYEAKLPF